MSECVSVDLKNFLLFVSVMKFVTPEISWHDRDPVYSVDFQYLEGNIRRLASCGTDRQIRVFVCLRLLIFTLNKMNNFLHTRLEQIRNIVNYPRMVRVTC